MCKAQSDLNSKAGCLNEYTVSPCYNAALRVHDIEPHYKRGETTTIYSKPRLSRTRLSRILAQLGQNPENGWFVMHFP